MQSVDLNEVSACVSVPTVVDFAVKRSGHDFSRKGLCVGGWGLWGFGMPLL